MLKDEFPRHEPLTNPNLKIVCWNIAKNKNHNWYSDFYDIHKRYKPHLFIFQEAKMEIKLEKLFKSRKMGWRFLPNIMHHKKQFLSGVLTASSLFPVEVNIHKSNSREPVIQSPKATLMTTYEIANSDEKLLIINIHGINFVSLRHFRNQIHEIVEYGMHHHGPIIFSGDFNTWTKNRVLFLEKILNRKLNLIPIFFERKHKRKIKNFIFSPPLDHIFYSYKKMKLAKNSAEVLRHYKSSDHKPIFAEFRLCCQQYSFEKVVSKKIFSCRSSENNTD